MVSCLWATIYTKLMFSSHLIRSISCQQHNVTIYSINRCLKLYLTVPTPSVAWPGGLCLRAGQGNPQEPKTNRTRSIYIISAIYYQLSHSIPAQGGNYQIIWRHKSCHPWLLSLAR